MQGINTGRVIIGGIAAGVVYFAIEFAANVVLFAEQAQAMTERLGIDPQPTPAQMVVFAIVSLGMGIAVAYLYAAIRPRFGEGPGTGVCAGLLAWAFVALFLNISWITVGLLPMGFGVVVTVFQAVEFSVLGLVAGMLYQEE